MKLTVSTMLLFSFIVASAQAHKPVVVKPGEGRIVEVPFHDARKLLGKMHSEAGVSVYEFVLGPESGGAPPHIHTHEDEYVYIVDGNLTLMLEEQITEAGPGTLAALTRGAVHAFWNNTDKPVKTLFFISMGGFEEFFDAIAVSLRESPPANSDEANARIGALAAEQGIEIRADLIPADVLHLYQPK